MIIDGAVLDDLIASAKASPRSNPAVSSSNVKKGRLGRMGEEVMY